MYEIKDKDVAVLNALLNHALVSLEIKSEKITDLHTEIMKSVAKRLFEDTKKYIEERE